MIFNANSLERLHGPLLVGICEAGSDIREDLGRNWLSNDCRPGLDILLMAWFHRHAFLSQQYRFTKENRKPQSRDAQDAR
jgi:hypothetical protein